MRTAGWAGGAGEFVIITTGSSTGGGVTITAARTGAGLGVTTMGAGLEVTTTVAGAAECILEREVRIGARELPGTNRMPGCGCAEVRGRGACVTSNLRRWEVLSPPGSGTMPATRATSPSRPRLEPEVGRRVPAGARSG